MTHPKSISEAFWSHVQMGTQDGCWGWKGHLSHRGYGKLYAEHRHLLGHRVSFYLHEGRWPDDTLRHLCNQAECTNPNHLVEGILPMEDKLWNQVEKGPSCWEWTGRTNSGGYGVLKHRDEHYLAHRVSYLIHNGHWPEPLCRHTCHNRVCVNPEHLIQGTQQENVQDCVDAGRRASQVGHDNHSAKLTSHDVARIKDLYLTGNWTYRQLAKEFDVGRQTIGNAINGKTFHEKVNR